MKKYILSFLVLTAICGVSYTQTDSVFILPKLKIDQVENKKDVTYRFEEYELNKFILNDSVLTANTSIYDYKVKLGDMKRISIYTGRDFWGGATVGSITGFGLGFLFWGFFTLDEHPDYKFYVNHAFLGGFITALPFGLIGGLIGLLSPIYENYEMKSVPAKDRAEYLKKVFRKNKVRFK